MAAMELELELEAVRDGGGGSRVVSLAGDSPAADLGRGHLAPAQAPALPADLTVSRRHVSLRLLGGGDPRLAFEVLGRNPVVVRSSSGGDKVYRRGEAGELRAGDALSLSLKVPSFWMVRRRGRNEEAEAEADVDTEVLVAVARREKRTRERKEAERRAVEEPMSVTEEEEEEEEEEMAAVSEELDPEEEGLEFDLASIDPVREFRFLSMGHEFDNYPKGRIRPPNEWNWFLEETKRSSDDEDDNVSSKRGKSKSGRGASKKKKEAEGEDEDWTDESEDEKKYLQAGPSVKRPKKYVTRSTDPKKPRTENSLAKGEINDDTDEDEEEDEEDETIGGFIVNEEDVSMEVEELSEEEEEEEFNDDDKDD